MKREGIFLNNAIIIDIADLRWLYKRRRLIITAFRLLDVGRHFVYRLRTGDRRIRLLQQTERREHSVDPTAIHGPSRE